MHNDRFYESDIGLVQRSWRRVSSGDEPQRIGLHLQSLCQSLKRAQTKAHQTLDATDQRQGRTVHSDPLQGMGLRNAVPELPGAKRLAASKPVNQ